MSQRSLSELAKSFLMLVVLDTLERALLFGHFDTSIVYIDYVDVTYL